MNLATSSTAPPAAPAQALDPFRQEIRDINRRIGEGSQLKISLMASLRRVYQEKLFLAWGCEDFDDYLKKDQLPFGAKTAIKRFGVADLPLAAFAGTDFSWHLLEEISRRYNKGDGEDLKSLIATAQDDRDELETPRRKRRTLDELKDNELARRVGGGVAGVMPMLVELGSRVDCRTVEYGWKDKLVEDVRSFGYLFMDRFGLTAEELWPLRRGTERGEVGIGPCGTEEEKDSDQEGLGVGRGK